MEKESRAIPLALWGKEKNFAQHNQRVQSGVGAHPPTETEENTTLGQVVNPRAKSTDVCVTVGR